MIRAFLLNGQAGCVRFATPDDAGAVTRLQKHSALVLCASHYSPETMAAWSRLVVGHGFGQMLVDRAAMVAEVGDASGRRAIVGYGQAHPYLAEIEAVYVLPVVAGNGVGSMLLGLLEDRLRRSGAQTIAVRSTLNAREFYERHGFVFNEQGRHVLKDGAVLDYILMNKTIT